jgi:hypothetical protein
LVQIDRPKGGVMPHYKCVACKTRLHYAGTPPELVGDLCPECGSLLEPVGELAEIVGFRSIKPRDYEADAGPLGTHQRIADRIDGFVSRREELLAQARVDAERWVDEDGNFFAEAAAALPRPQPHS